MRIFKLFIHLLLLVTTPTLFAYPQSAYSLGKNFKKKERFNLVTYDEILQLLDDIETGKAEKKYSLKEQKRINRFLAYLAKEGTLPHFGNAITLQADIHELLDEVDQSGPTIQMVMASKWFSRNWKKTKKFAKKHKKEILIGAAIVVAATVVIVAVAASASACAATAVAAAGSAAVKKDPSSSNYKTLEEITESPQLVQAIEENIETFKSFLEEDATITPPQKWDDLSFGEKARELGAFLAHQAFEEVTELVSIIPQFAEEVQEVGNRLFPSLPETPLITSPAENYATFVAGGHDAIDKVFSTDQAEIFDPEFKSTIFSESFTLGIIPLPGGLKMIFPNLSKLLETGSLMDRAGFTFAGRSLMKHGYREGSVFPKPFGNPAQINYQGQRILEEIISNPNSEVFLLENGSVKIFSPNGRGVHYKKDGSFKNFIEKQHEK